MYQTFVTSFLLIVFSLASCTNSPEPSGTKDSSIPPPPEPDVKPSVYVIPGDYHEMLLGLDGDKITGAYRSKDGGENPCFFFFEGKVSENNPVKVECYNPLSTQPPTSGNFKIMGKEMLVKLRQSIGNHCNPELSDEIGYPLLLDLQHKWLAIRVIEKETSLYESDMEGLDLGDKLKKGTIVAVKEYKKDWLRVAVPHMNYGKDGWVHKSALFPLIEL